MKNWNKSGITLKAIGLVSSLCLCSVAQADGITDLRGALNRLQAQSNVKAVLEVKSSRKQGEDKEAIETNGQINVNLEDGSRGMQISLSKEVLNKLEQEARARIKDKESKSPTRQASFDVNTEESQMMLSAVNALQRQIEEASFKSEKNDSYNGKPARLLTFEFGMERLPASAKKYIKNFESRLEIWINTDGTPLASKLVEQGNGRAFIVVSFQQASEEHNVYQVVGDRLLITRRESKNKSSGAGERADTKVIKTLQVQI
ncbi:hypothetical protein [Undibacterium sp. Di24W]|uniref:hypothetical protein n=1 Tax=Undibacterium sp. Di24W TaxID=3413033 RepID=UPI003BF1E405